MYISVRIHLTYSMQSLTSLPNRLNTIRPHTQTQQCSPELWAVSEKNLFQVVQLGSWKAR